MKDKDIINELNHIQDQMKTFRSVLRRITNEIEKSLSKVR